MCFNSFYPSILIQRSWVSTVYIINYKSHKGTKIFKYCTCPAGQVTYKLQLIVKIFIYGNSLTDHTKYVSFILNI